MKNDNGTTSTLDDPIVMASYDKCSWCLQLVPFFSSFLLSLYFSPVANRPSVIIRMTVVVIRHLHISTLIIYTRTTHTTHPPSSQFFFFKSHFQQKHVDLFCRFFNKLLFNFFFSLKFLLLQIYLYKSRSLVLL